MIARLLVDAEFEVTANFDEENDFPETESQLFKKGTELDFEVVDYGQFAITGKDDPNCWNIQFPDGSVAFGCSREWFEILEGEDELPEIES